MNNYKNERNWFMPGSLKHLNVLPRINRYPDKIRTFMPDLSPAGLLDYDNGTVGDCMQFPCQPHQSKATARFSLQSDPNIGDPLVNFSKIYDKERCIAHNMRHGITKVIDEQNHITSKDIIYPDIKTDFELLNESMCEASYDSSSKPIEHSKIFLCPLLPEELRFSTFGKPKEKCQDSVGSLINPAKYCENGKITDYEECHWHKLYKLSHRDYYPGEHLNRDYFRSFDKNCRFGIPGDYDSSGDRTKWCLENKSKCGKTPKTLIISSIQDCVSRMKQHQLGKSLELTDALCGVPKSQTFGMLNKIDYNAGDVIHERCDHNILKGFKTLRSKLAMVRNHLKTANYYNFDTICQAFLFYDKKNEGNIDEESFKITLLQFNICLDVNILCNLFKECDANGNGYIDLNEFANFLTFRDSMPFGVLVHQPCSNYCNKTTFDEAKPLRICKQIDPSVTDNSTTNSKIGECGNIDLSCYRSAGLSRKELEKNTPLEITAYSLIYPSVFTQQGIFEEDFVKPRNEEQLRTILKNSCIDIDDQMFDCVFAEASKEFNSEFASLEAFRRIFKEFSKY